ncbi:Druantia anti-phage system protein DruA [Acidiferrobacter sp. SPIII_3]|uniref:Druantia anti-phage system protein DruA n=1 Tax=Acidiferrobacter sp. SPIII_3 TaxID=1281578 RepID=UPI00197AE976|nr:Druantia anti-phage system protein DruA [Acidiferrobacter sp. SPIII_3]
METIRLATAYGVRPLLAETFVDPTRFTGHCYRAAHWIDVGLTTGRGREDRHHERHGQAPSASWSTRWCPMPDKGSCKPRKFLSGRPHSRRSQFTLRIADPYHTLLTHRFELGCMVWL